jgi:hypothetical protein
MDLVRGIRVRCLGPECSRAQDPLEAPAVPAEEGKGPVLVLPKSLPLAGLQVDQGEIEGIRRT